MIPRGESHELNGLKRLELRVKARVRAREGSVELFRYRPGHSFLSRPCDIMSVMLTTSRDLPRSGVHVSSVLPLLLSQAERISQLQL